MNFFVLRSKAYSFKCKSDDKSKNEMKGVSKSQSKHIKFGESRKSLHGERYQEDCENHILRSVNHEMYL